MRKARLSIAINEKDVMGTQRLESLAKKCKSSGSLFEDPEFPATDASIWQDTSNKSSWLSKFKTIEWKRASEIGDPREPAVVWKNGISADDIKQGAVGDCYFLAALGNIATRPELIENLIVEEHGHHGIYGVKFFKMGKWTTVIVDDRFPCYIDGDGRYQALFASYKTPEHGGTPDKEIWMMIAEKAWAKLHGSYQVIANGMVPDTMVYLTGGFSEVLHMEDDSVWADYLSGKLWESLYKDTRQSSSLGVVFMSCSGVQEQETTLKIGQQAAAAAEDGLKADHAYSILALKEFPDKTRPHGKLRLINVRNPWGSYEWKGDYSDSSPLWTPELERACNLKREDDGSFWMAFEDFCDYFEFVGLCTMVPGEWTSRSLQTQWKAEVSAGGRIDRLRKFNPTFYLKNHNERVVIQVEQDDIRDNPPDKAFFYDVFVNVIHKTDKPHPDVFDTVLGFTSPESRDLGHSKTLFRMHSSERVRNLEMLLPPGEYYVVLTLQHPGFQGACSLNVISAGPFDISEVAPPKPSAEDRRMMKEVVLHKDPRRPRCCMTNAVIDLSNASSFEVRKGVFWDISNPKNFRCCKCLRSFNSEDKTMFFDVGEEDGRWRGYCRRDFKNTFYDTCIVCSKAIYDAEECNRCNGAFVRVDEGRVHEECWVDYMLQRSKSNLVCPYNSPYVGKDEVALVVRTKATTETMGALQKFVDQELK